ncbi:MAG TPA: hypothetical protein EYP92_00045, partial [Candidatus Thioglobus sp.]|nr:hypothetical protein [Candidatus Thioglobus sp.]
MAYNKILLKRRNTVGGTPSTIDYGELAWNQADHKLYIGRHDSATGAPQVKALAGEGFFLALDPESTTNQTLKQDLIIGTGATGISHYLQFQQQG